MSSTATTLGRQHDERWRFWRDVIVFQLKVLLGNLRDFALIPISLVAAVIDVVSKGEREGSLFYRVLWWGAHSDEVLDPYSPVKDQKLAVNPSYTVDGVIARIESVMVREYEKGGTAGSIKAALDRVIDQVQHGTGGHREKAQSAIAKASEGLRATIGIKEIRPQNTNTIRSVVGEPVSFPRAAEGGSYSDGIRIRSMTEADAAAVAELTGELGYPNESENIRRRIGVIDAADLLLVAVDPADKVIGFIQAHRVCIIEVGSRVEILGLIVSAEARRGGIGRKLMAEVEGWAKEIVEAVVVRSNTKRTESHVFYPAMGYTNIKTQAVYEKRLSEQAQTEAGFPQGSD